MLAQHIVPLLPPHHLYVEVFGGGASVLFAKRPSPVEVYNDLDLGLATFYRVLRDPDSSRSSTARSRSPPSTGRSTRRPKRPGRRWMTPWNGRGAGTWRCGRASPGCMGAGWSLAVGMTRRGMSGSVSHWLSAVEGLPQIHARLSRVQVECQDWRGIFATYDKPYTVFYVDPPYVPETRSSGTYRDELTMADHEELVGTLLGMEGAAVLSGYSHDLYVPLEMAGWRVVEIPVLCRATGKTQATGLQGEGIATATPASHRTECLWVSPSAAAHQGELFGGHE